MKSDLFRPAFLIDRWLWRKGLGHPQIMPILRNEMLLALVSLLAGLALFLVSSWLFWFGVGASVMAMTFYGLARFFLRTNVGGYETGLLISVLIRWAGRLLLTVILLYVALVLCAAPVSAILSGLVSASILALVTYAVQAKRS